MSEHDDVLKLLSLKKYETPGEEYFDKFLDEFHERQRRDILRKSSRSLFFERLNTWLSGFGREKWLLTGGISYAVVMLTLYLKPDAPEASPIRHVSDPVFLNGSPHVQADLIRFDDPSVVTSANHGKAETGTTSSPKAGRGSPFINLDELEILPVERGIIREF